jgi:hypothetical protein
MTVSDHWMYQGRQEHGWFGHGTAPQDDSGAAAGGLFNRANAGERVDYAARSLIGHLPRSAGGHYAATSDARSRG